LIYVLQEEADAELQTLNSENEDLRSKLQQKTDEVAKVGRAFSIAHLNHQFFNIEKLEAILKELDADVKRHALAHDELTIHLKETEEKLERVGNAASESNAKIMALNRDGERLRSQAVSPPV
jgi:chromosome segregation ATPase